MKSGWIILDKDSGLFSRTAGGRVARMLGTKKFGHIGTLDPMATGVLPIAIGDATKMIPFIEEHNPSTKEYLFSVQFGFETDTLDITGQETYRNNIVPTVSDV
ncbi:MAG: tRNA pseudouridine(55) synthase TruB, partial [Alphaproteobacteria bacterium]|nr:tRNA pseudouridine(55) synthase TruB [Alphaproteobacteria bacterium]